MPSLPEPDDLASLVLRTDFDDDRRWVAFQAELNDVGDYRMAMFVSGTAYAGATIQQLVDLDATAREAAEQGIVLRVVNAHRRVAKVLDVTGLLELLQDGALPD
jgi:hypothetical protein